MKLWEVLKKGENFLADRGIDNPGTDAWLMLENVLDINRTYYFLHQQDEMEMSKYTQYFTMLTKRSEHIPLQHLTGEQEFMGFPFYVNENVLIPRQDTECLVEEAIKVLKPGMRVLDMCTGSGCIIISLMKLVPSIRGTAVDISAKALDVARSNARRNQAVVDFREGDLFRNLDGTYDVIVSNPPYIATDEITKLMAEVREFEPMAALDGREDGLYFYRRIIEKSRFYLKKEGWLLFEIGYDQARPVTDLMKASGFEKICVIRDLAGLDRVVKGQIV